MQISARGVRFTRAEYLSDDFQLPPDEYAHDVIKYKMFTWMALLYTPIDEKKIVVTCTTCNHQYRLNWPMNTTTLKDHYEKTHHKTVEQVKMESFAAVPPPETTAGTAPVQARDIPRVSPVIGSSMPVGANASEPLLFRTRRVPQPRQFDAKEYMLLLMAMITSNNLSFSLVDTESFIRFCRSLNPDAPKANRALLKEGLTGMFRGEILRMKQRLAENTSQFALSVHKWNPEKDVQFLRIGVHYYNNLFKLESHMIGLEAWDEKAPSAGEFMANVFMKVLHTYGIEKRVLSITRDSGKAMSDMMKSVHPHLDYRGVGFRGDVRCLADALVMSLEPVLCFAYLKPNGTQEFDQSVNSILDEYPDFQPFAQRMKYLPLIARSLIDRILRKREWRDVFEALVAQDRTEPAHLTEGVDKPDLGDGVSAAFGTIDHIVRFHGEILTVMLMHGVIYVEGDKFHISDTEWEYLKTVRDLLELYLSLAAKLRATPPPTINETIPLVYGLLSDLNDASMRLKENPLLAFGVEQAKRKLLQIYPTPDEGSASNRMLYIAIVLDPRFKLSVFSSVGFSAADIRAIKSTFCMVYGLYQRRYKDEIKHVPVDPTLKPRPTGNFRPFLFVSRDVLKDDEDEVEKYLREPRELEEQDIVAFYQNRKSSFPVISRMARDYFAVPAVSTIAGSVPSSVAEIVTKKRSRCLPNAIKMMAILKTRGVIRDEGGTGDDLDCAIDENSEDADSGGEVNDGNGANGANGANGRGDVNVNNVTSGTSGSVGSVGSVGTVVRTEQTEHLPYPNHSSGYSPDRRQKQTKKNRRVERDGRTDTFDDLLPLDDYDEDSDREKRRRTKQMRKLKKFGIESDDYSEPSDGIKELLPLDDNSENSDSSVEASNLIAKRLMQIEGLRPKNYRQPR